MKNIIKIIAILATATSFFLVYSMEKPLKYFTISKLKHLSDMTKFSLHFNPFWQFRSPSVASKDYPSPLPEDLVLKLSAIKVIENPDTPDKDKILKRIFNAFSQGTSTTPNHTVWKNGSRLNLGVIQLSQSPISLCTIIKGWLAALTENLSATLQPRLKEILSKQESCRSLIYAIKQGKLSHKETKNNVLTTFTHDTLEIEIPEEITNLILEFFPECNFDEEEELIKQYDIFHEEPRL